MLINARNVGGFKNNFLGAVLGLFKGGIFVLILVLIMQSLSWVTQNHAMGRNQWSTENISKLGS